MNLLKITLAAASLAVSTISFQAGAAMNEPREAWISAGSFDGKIFSYEYIAYDATEPVKDGVKISCDYTSSAFGLLLKAVDVKILIDAKFTTPGSQVKRTGSVDVRKAVNDCQKALPIGRGAVKGPVAIRLPRISISSEDPANQPAGNGTFEPVPPVDQ